jgi:hypothetical protein
MRPPACGDASADNYGRKLKPTAKKTRKHDEKRRRRLKNPQKGHAETPNKEGNDGSNGVAGVGYVIDTCGPSYCTKTA